MALLLIGLLLFLGVHSFAIFAPALRELAIARMGRNGWRGVYSLLSLGGFVLLILGYGQARLAPVLLYQPPFWMKHVVFLLMLPVFPLLLAAYLPGRIKATVKHPMLAAVKIWALAHLLANGMLADVLLFGGFLVWAVADRVSLKRRGVPLNLSAKQSARNDAIAVVAGLALYAATLLWLHRMLIGMPLM